MRRAVVALFALFMLADCSGPVPTVVPTPTINLAPTQTRTAELVQLTAVAAQPTNTPAPMVVIIATQAPTPTATPDQSVASYWRTWGSVLTAVHDITVNLASTCSAPDEKCQVAQTKAMDDFSQQIMRTKGLAVPPSCAATNRAISDYLTKTSTYIGSVGAYITLHATQIQFLQSTTKDMQAMTASLDTLTRTTSQGTCKP